LQFTTPPNTTFQSIGSHPSYTCTTPTAGTTGTVVCNIGTLAAGASGSLGITINVASGIPAGSLIERNYSIASAQETLLVGTAVSTQVWYAADTVAANQSSVNFGAVAAATGSMQTVTFTVPSVITLGSVSAVTQGAKNLDFRVVRSGTTCASGTTNKSCTVEVQFLPAAPGMRLGAIVLYDTAAPPNVLATVYLTGTGLGSAVAFSPSSQIAVPATGLNLAAGVAFDAAGDVFIADSYNGRAVEVTPGGTQTTVATGLNNPLSLAVDGVGDVFIADSVNNRVVEVLPGGNQTTVTVTGLNLPKSVAVDGTGDVFIADSSQVVEVTPSGIQTTVPATGLISPSGVAVDAAGDVFIADVNNSRVVEVQRSTPLTLSFASTAVGSTSTDSPQSAAIQNIGNQALNAVSTGLSIGANFVQVAGSGQPADCNGSFSLVPGANCNLSISFSPQSIGSIVSAATFTDNALNAAAAHQSIPLQGTGTQGSAWSC
jgi:hypothetical protein